MTHGMMNIFGYNFFWTKYWSPSSIMFISDGSKLWHMAQSKIATWHINYILEIINKYKYIF
jgi:hypothetical protein